MSQPETIPSKIANLQGIYERRYVRRKEAFDELSSEAAEDIDPLVTEHKKAVRAFEDHFDECLLKYGRDPNSMPLDDRDPHELKSARSLKRTMEDAQAAVRKKEAELNKNLKNTNAYTALRTAQIEYEDWLAKVCTHFQCCAADLDWNEREIKRPQEVCQEVPAELLAVPVD